VKSIDIDVPRGPDGRVRHPASWSTPTASSWPPPATEAGASTIS